MFDVKDWPIQNDALDYIVLPHVLEFVDDPHAVLREAARCLRPGGSMTILGFNPNSVLAAQSASAGLGKSSAWISRSRLLDWMHLLDLHMDMGAFGQWRPYCVHPHRFERVEQWLHMDALGERFWPQMANVYALRVVKRVSPDLRRLIAPKRFALRGPRVSPAVKTRHVDLTTLTEAVAKPES